MTVMFSCTCRHKNKLVGAVSGWVMGNNESNLNGLIFSNYLGRVTGVVYGHLTTARIY